MRAWAAVAAVLIGVVIAGSLAVQTFRTETADLGVGPVGALHSVMLTNGQVYYGRLRAITHDAVVLGDVFYVQAADPKTGERMNRLVSRQQNDWHAPTRMSVPLDKIEFVEVVGEDSAVAKLIAEAKRPSGNGR